MHDKSVLIVSVGGSPNVVAKAIEYNKCKFIIFFCSAETYSAVNDIKNSLGKDFVIEDFERIVVDEYEILSKCCRKLNNEIPQKLKQWGKDYKDVIVDYTGGTKAMSAALVLSTIENCSSYSYIGGNDRSKEGVGIVIDGKERYCYHQNPWDELALNHLKIIDSSFNNARYVFAQKQIEDILPKVDEKLKKLYEILKDMCELYYRWDSFKYKDANNLFGRVLNGLKHYQALSNESIDYLVGELEKGQKWMNELVACINNNGVVEGVKGSMMVCSDFISNAKRRAEKENKYDDAVARLYSCIEKMAKYMLLEFGIDNSKTRKDQIPCELENKFESALYYDKDEKKEFYKYGLSKSCDLLSHKDEDFKARYVKMKKELENLMTQRNKSALAHGITPIKKETYEKMLETTLKFAKISEDEIIRFPTMNVSLWGKEILK